MTGSISTLRSEHIDDIKKLDENKTIKLMIDLIESK